MSWYLLLFVSKNNFRCFGLFSWAQPILKVELFGKGLPSITKFLCSIYFAIALELPRFFGFDLGKIELNILLKVLNISIITLFHLNRRTFENDPISF